MLPSAGWHKSSYSNNHDAACVEVRRTGRGIRVRDSKDLARSPLAVTAGSWSAFVAKVLLRGR
jgi:hypothetical protein